MVDFSFIVSLYVSDLPNVTITSYGTQTQAGLPDGSEYTRNVLSGIRRQETRSHMTGATKSQAVEYLNSQ